MPEKDRPILLAAIHANATHRPLERLEIQEQESRPLHGLGGVEGLAFGEDVGGDAAEFFDEAEPGENF